MNLFFKAGIGFWGAMFIASGAYCIWSWYSLIISLPMIIVSIVISTSINKYFKRENRGIKKYGAAWRYNCARGSCVIDENGRPEQMEGEDLELYESMREERAQRRAASSFARK